MELKYFGGVTTEICVKQLIRGIKVRQSGSKTEAKRHGKMHRNFHTNSTAGLASSSTSKELVRRETMK